MRPTHDHKNPKNKDLCGLLTPRELADLLKVSPPTVMSYFRRGIIPAEIAVDRVFRFDREKCLAALRGFSRTEGAADTRDAQ